ncbi:hypothetical protein S83_066415 [Arachis hypogaea]
MTDQNFKPTYARNKSIWFIHFLNQNSIVELHGSVFYGTTSNLYTLEYNGMEKLNYLTPVIFFPSKLDTTKQDKNK